MCHDKFVRCIWWFFFFQGFSVGTWWVRTFGIPKWVDFRDAMTLGSPTFILQWPSGCPLFSLLSYASWDSPSPCNTEVAGGIGCCVTGMWNLLSLHCVLEMHGGRQHYFLQQAQRETGLHYHQLQLWLNRSHFASILQCWTLTVRTQEILGTPRRQLLDGKIYCRQHWNLHEF